MASQPWDCAPNKPDFSPIGAMSERPDGAPTGVPGFLTPIVDAVVHPLHSSGATSMGAWAHGHALVQASRVVSGGLGRRPNPPLAVQMGVREMDCSACCPRSSAGTLRFAFGSLNILLTKD